jgi:hypothetical protein
VQKGLESRILSTPIVVFSHMPVRMIYEPWWWETGEATQAIEYLRRFGSVTELNRHIHRIVSKGEGNITFHTARSTTFPQSTAGNGPGPVSLTITRDQLPRVLGVTSVTIAGHPRAAALPDSTIA